MGSDAASVAASAAASIRRACGGSICMNVGPGPAAVAAVVEQLVDLRGHPAVAGQAAGVVVDDHDQRVLLLAGVAEHADHLVAIAVGVGVDVALCGLDGADVLGPGRPGDALVHQGKSGMLGLDGLPRRAEAGDAGQQRERGRAALLGCVPDEPLADQFLDSGATPGTTRAPAGLVTPPGAEQLADHELGIERTAHGEQLAGGAQHLGKQRVRRRASQTRASAAAWQRSGGALMTPVAR